MKVWKCALDGLLLSKAYKVSDEKIQKSSNDTGEFAKSEEKLALDFKNDMANLVNFNVSSGKPENLHFDVLLLSKA